MTGEDAARSGKGGSARPGLANPYDLSTWSSAAPTAEPPGESAAPRYQAPEAQPPPARPVRGSRGAAAHREVAPAHEEELSAPPELPAPADPSEPARRTVNRSRAAARDRGLFPLPAKTQPRDVRDRSARAPGYSGS